MDDKRKKKLLENAGLGSQTSKTGLIAGLAMILRVLVEDKSVLSQIYESNNLLLLETASAVLESLQRNGDFYIQPRSPRKKAEPMFWLVPVESPGYYSWVTVLQFAETYLAAACSDESPSDLLKEPSVGSTEAAAVVTSTGADVPDPCLEQELKEILELDLSSDGMEISGDHLEDEHPFSDTEYYEEELGLSQSEVYGDFNSHEVQRYDPGLSRRGLHVGGVSLSDTKKWSDILLHFNRFGDTPDRIPQWETAKEGGFARPPGISHYEYEILYRALRGRIETLRNAPGVRVLGVLSQYYGSPVLKEDWYYRIGRARFKIGFFSRFAKPIPLV